jgi:tetratricopeptide (TPR) repeat protein
MKSYYLALIHGTEHLITTYGYFNLGNVFASQDKMDKAIDFLRKVVDIWAKQLLLAITRERQRAKDEDDEANAESAPTPDLKDRDETKLELEELDEEKIFEANHMFEHILNIEMQRYGENHIETGKVFQVYGLYQYWIGEVVKARDCLEKACNIMKYVLGENHSSTREIRQLIEQISM